jgi:hypothetical protein
LGVKKEEKKKEERATIPPGLWRLRGSDDKYEADGLDTYLHTPHLLIYYVSLSSTQ